MRGEENWNPGVGVYVVCCESEGHPYYKIGKTRDWDQRKGQLWQTSRPFGEWGDLELVAWFECGDDDAALLYEGAYHDFFGEFRYPGTEWFDLGEGGGAAIHLAAAIDGWSRAANKITASREPDSYHPLETAHA